MAELIQILGFPSLGKTTSLENLKEKESYIINTMSKRLPFRPSWETDTTQSGREGHILNKPKLEAVDVEGIMGNLRFRDEIKNIIVDDAHYLMAIDFMKPWQAYDRKNQYKKFEVIARRFWEMFLMKDIFDADKRLIIIAHLDADSRTPDSMEQYTIRSYGKLIREKLGVEGLSTLIFCPHVEVNRIDNYVKYFFSTQTDGDFPARSPRAMFPREIKNDLALILERIEEFDAGISLEESKLDMKPTSISLT